MKYLKPVVLSIMVISAFSLDGCAAWKEERKCGLAGCADDQAITANVQAKLSHHPAVGTEVTVQTLDLIVYLSGFVSSGNFSEVAEAVTRTVPGVSKVVNQIAVTH